MKTLLALILTAMIPLSAQADRFELTVVSLCDGRETYAVYSNRTLAKARFWQRIFRRDPETVRTWIKRVSAKGKPKTGGPLIGVPR